MKPKIFFLVGSPRSGTTSLAKILSTANNGVCLIEPTPNLAVESRKVMEGMLNVSNGLIEEAISPRVRDYTVAGKVYGEKNVTYAPFIPQLYELFDPKFIFVFRDGRDVVRSMINWHEQKFGNIYRECQESGNLSPEALSSVANLPVHLDVSDYARPRPRNSDPLSFEWMKLSRFEMCAYYWAFINDLYLDQFEKMPKDAWMSVEYSEPKPADIKKVFDFLELSGFDDGRIQSLLERKINSNKDRGAKEGNFPTWQDWDSGFRRKFTSIAGKTMSRLGYWNSGIEWVPKDYGMFWKDHQGGIDWYTWMYNSRAKSHKSIIAWVQQREQLGDSIETVMDFGCGLAVGYSEDFKEKNYIGVDLSEPNILWLKEHRINPKHQYLCKDFVLTPPDLKVDLVFSSGTVDNAYDVDRFLEAMVNCSTKWICFTCYRGWFPDLEEHQYTYNEAQRCFYNNLSPKRISEKLVSLGCVDIRIYPISTGNPEIPFETMVTARVADRTTL